MQRPAREPLRLLSDDPIRDRERDGLGLAKWAEVVASAALGSEGPFTIGVFGRWGVGKTSVLHLAKQLIDSSPEAARREITTLLFNAWQYERDSTPLIPLIASILQQLEQQRGRRRRGGKPMEELRTALRSALYGMSAGVTARVPLLSEATLTLDAEKSIKRWEALRTQWIDQQMERSLYFNAFTTMRETQQSENDGGRHKIVVFIDDLDRCFPDRALRLLESIKLVLSEPGFIFVLGVDRSLLETYLDKRYSQHYGFREYQRAQSYLAKFIQLPLWIPAHTTRFHRLIERLLAQSALTGCRKELEPLADEIGLACGYNPRQLIRFLNDLLVDRFLFSSQDEFPFRAFVAGRGIRLQSEVVYHGLLKLRPLCEKLCACADASAVRKLVSQELASTSEAQPEFDILLRIQANDELAALLTSQIGKEWLESERSQSQVEGALVSRVADESEELERWIRAGTQRALTQINSEEWDAVMAGCYYLAQFETPLRLQAVRRLFELTSSSDPRIAEEARRTLETICSVPQPGELWQREATLLRREA